MSRFGGPGHLAGRFVSSLWPGGPPPAAEEWAERHLSEAERGLWRRMSGPDRRHALAVARRVERALGDGAARPPVPDAIYAAALLHDVGKVEAGLGTFGRVAATLAGLAGRLDLTPRVGRYLRHDRLGAELLELAGSDPLTVAWAREHHLPRERWTVPPVAGAILEAADDD